MLANQKNKFRIPENICYLNGAYMSPLMKSVEQAGHSAVSQKCLPYEIGASDFFSHSEDLRRRFAVFVEAPDPQNIAIIPSVSYAMANIANNVKIEAGDEIILIEEQFPSNVYAWKKIAEKKRANIIMISQPRSTKDRGKIWNQLILQAINKKTAVIALGPLHWADGTLFDLKAIRKKTRQHDAMMIIDGSQCVGAAPFSVAEFQPDALVVVGYKWLLGPYSIGLAYFSDAFNQGEPIEDSWINRFNSQDFSGLVKYESRYQPKAGRYNVGEYSNFMLTPMLQKSLEQLQLWGPENIQNYTRSISAEGIVQLRNLGCFIEEEAFRASHLFGVYLPERLNLKKLKSKFREKEVYVSLRGSAIRVSPNVYNTAEDFEKLVSCFKGL